MDKLNTFTADIRRLDSTIDSRNPGAEPAPGGRVFASVLDSVQGSSADTTPHDSSRSQDSPQPEEQVDNRSARAPSYTVRNGDSLSVIAQNLARQRGLGMNSAESYRLALDLAARNQIRNPDRIQPGQQLQLDGLHATLDDGGRGRLLEPSSATVATVSAPTGSTAGLNSTQNWLARRGKPEVTTLAAKSAAMTSGSGTPTERASREHPVLQQTLDRAVARGFIPAHEKQAVQGKILQLAEKYRFAPDDFARMTLMESDGMNPRASNQRCHGIIQFCDGPSRGAAAVGYGQQPRAILGLSVYQQLHLVDNYFQDNGLGKNGPAKLDDLYLTVLQPAARQEKQAHVPLNIPGQQARDLHVGANTSQAITRQSIVQGLLKVTQEKLSNVFGQVVGSKPEPTQIAQGPSARQNLSR